MSLEEATPGEPCSPRCWRHAVAAEQVADAGRGDSVAEFEQLASDALVTPKRGSPWPAGAPAPGTRPEPAGDHDCAVGQTLPGDDGPAPDASRGWWPAAPEQGTGRQFAAKGSQDQAIGHPPARSLSGASEDQRDTGGGRGVRDRDRQ